MIKNSFHLHFHNSQNKDGVKMANNLIIKFSEKRMQKNLLKK